MVWQRCAMLSGADRHGNFCESPQEVETFLTLKILKKLKKNLIFNFPSKN